MNVLSEVCINNFIMCETLDLYISQNIIIFLNNLFICIIIYKISYILRYRMIKRKGLLGCICYNLVALNQKLTMQTVVLFLNNLRSISYQTLVLVNPAIHNTRL